MIFKMYINLAKKNNLFIVGGSDYHGWKNEVYKGTEVPDDLINKFIKVLKK